MTAWRRRWDRLPLRARLVAGFVLALAVVLLAAGVFVYARVYVDLDTQLDHDLTDRAAVVQGRIGADGRVDATVGLAEYQTLDAANRVLSAGPGVPATSLLSAASFRAASAGPVHRQVGALVPESDRPLRLLAAPVEGAGPARVVVVGVRRDLRDESLRELAAALALGGVGALVVASLVGDQLARRALAPVERYRRQAAAIAADAAGSRGARLDVPQRRADEITRLGDTFNDVLDALEASVERERRFVADASHELRTPLTLLSTRVQLLRRRRRTVEEHEQALDELDRDVADLVSLGDQLLDLDVAGRGDDLGPVDLVAVVREARLDELGIHLVVRDEPMVVRSRTIDVRRIVANLVANARTHGAAPVEVGCRRVGPLAVLTLSDAGSGVPAHLLPHAADRFRRADDARTRSGAGLGLALVAALAGRDGAELRVCSNGLHHRAVTAHALPCDHPSAGTTVTVAWPLEEPAG